jgi:hypothetical protein
LNVTKRPETKPDNALVVTKAQLLDDNREYVRLREKAKREGRRIWVEDGEDGGFVLPETN